MYVYMTFDTDISGLNIL